MTQIKAKVPFTLANVMKCICPQCPVQAQSQCIAEKKARLQTALSHNTLKGEEIPGIYCSTGKATCDGLDGSQRCSCFDCAVYNDYKLGDGFPSCYYCGSGAAGQ